MLHIQIGPSPLALGLLVPITKAAGFAVCIVGRPGDDSPRRYGCAGTGPEGRLGYQAVEWFEGPKSLDDLPADLLARIEVDEPLLLTCTLRDRVDQRRGFIEALLRRRPGNAETVALACENAPHQLYDEIAQICDELGVHYLRTVVNRMCIKRPPDSDGRRMVFAHSLGEWLVERPSQPCSLLDALEQVEEFEVVDDLEARLARKLWMVNGAHQALALIAWEGNTGTLRVRFPDERAWREQEDDLRAAAQDRTVSARLDHLHGAMDDALSVKHPGLVDNLGYGVKHVVAYSEHPDSIKRVLGSFLRLELTPFIETLDVRLAQPARICAARAHSVASFGFVFNVFESLAANLDAFLDAKVVRANPGSIDPLDDLQAAEAYARLVDGWMPEKEATARVLRLAEGLADHRD